MGEFYKSGKRRGAHLIKHGMSGTRVHRIWKNMLNRCRNPNFPRFVDYGGRGIIVCDRWHSFENFLSDMGAAPHDKSLDRIDNNGNYEPGNCRWADQFEQANNARSNVLVTYNGETLTLTQWSRRVGVHRATLKSRIDHGFPTEQVLAAVKLPRKSRYLECGNVTKTVAEWSREKNIGADTLTKRIDKHGWSVDRALNTPPR